MKVLLVYPCDNGIGQIPIGLSLIQACLKRAGHETQVFDTTFFRQRDKRAGMEKLGVHKPADLAAHGVRMIEADINAEFVRAVAKFGPGLIAFSCLSYSFGLAKQMLDALRAEGITTPVIIGGAHPTVAPEETIACEHVDMICVGEGEEAMVELCDRVADHRPVRDIRNIWVKADGEVCRNGLRPFVDMDSLPRPDATGFPDMHFYKPFVGKVYRVGHAEISRGCVYSCSYCINAFVRELYNGNGRYHREKSIDKAICDIRQLADAHKLQMLRFWDETFLCMSRERLEEFARRYQREIALPLIVSTHPATVTEEHVRLLKKMGCVAVSIGIETGSYRIRRDVLNRNVTNERIIQAFRMVKNAGLRVTAFNMIGLPGETRRDIFETIRLNRIVEPDTTGPNFFYPYPGTKLREVCLAEGFISDDVPIVDHNFQTVLKMPQIAESQLKGLHKTFNLYVQGPGWMSPAIRFCERDNRVSDWLFHRLVKRYC